MPHRRGPILCVALIALFVLPALAQRSRIPNSNPCDGARAQMQVRLQFKDGLPANDVYLLVELFNSNGIPVKQVTTKREDRADLGLVPAGNYSVRVSGPGFETTNSPDFSVECGEGLHMEFVRVTPSKRNDGQGPIAATPGGVVSSSDLNASPKARKYAEDAGSALGKGDDKKAIEAADKALKESPKFPAAHMVRGFAYLHENDIPSAQRDFEQAIGDDDHYAPAYVQLARLKLASGDVAGMDAMLAKATTYDPQNTQALTMVANSKYMHADYDGAIAIAHKIHSMPHASMAIAHFIAGQCYERKNDPEHAMAEYKQFLAEAPQDPAAPQVKAAIEKLSSQAKK